MASGGIRQDITVEDHLFPGDDWTLEWTVRNEDGVNIDDLTGRTYNLYVLDHPRQPLSEARLTVEWGSGVSNPSGAIVRATVAAEANEGMTPRKYFYRKRRTDAGNRRTTAYGWFPVIDGSEATDQLR